MKSSFQFQNGHRITVFTCGNKVITKICDENWNPIKDYADGVLHCSELAYHKSIRDEHNKLDINSFVVEQSDLLTENTPEHTIVYSQTGSTITVVLNTLPSCA